MSRIALLAKGISRNDAIGAGVLGGVLGVFLGTVGESAVLGWLVSAGVGLLVGGALGALVGGLFRGFGGVAFGLIGGVLIGASTGEFKWLIPAALAGHLGGRHDKSHRQRGTRSFSQESLGPKLAG